MALLVYYLPGGCKQAVFCNRDYPVVTIGRQEDCEIFSEAENVSREHSRVRYSKDVYTVEDLDSRNGTYLDNRPVTKAVLEDGDQFKCGTFRVQFFLEENERPQRGGGPAGVAPPAEPGSALHALVEAVEQARRALPALMQERERLEQELTRERDRAEDLAGQLAERRARLAELEQALSLVQRGLPAVEPPPPPPAAAQDSTLVDDSSLRPRLIIVTDPDAGAGPAPEPAGGRAARDEGED